MLVSAFYLVINIVEGKLCYADAGRPIPFHVCRVRGVTEPLRSKGPQGPVLGIFEKATYQNSHCEASVNDLVVLFTDGLFEVEMANDEYYGAERLLAAVCKRISLPTGQLFGEGVAEIGRSCV